MNYIWSKLSLLKFLENSIDSVVWNTDYTFSDLFSWTSTVWKYFKSRWHKVISNDLQFYSYVLTRHYVWNNQDLYFSWLIDIIDWLFETDIIYRKNIVCNFLDNIEPVEWFIYKNYSLWWTQNLDFPRQYFSDENAKKADAIRQKIEFWKEKKLINEDEYFFLLTCLLESIDKVANTASVYWAFLKSLKKSAQKTMKFLPVENIISSKKNLVFNKNINEVVKNISQDVVYLDPPYNHRQYSWNYHILETIALYDSPEIVWKTWMRKDSKKSLYCSRSQVKKEFEDLIKNIKANYIFLSYNDEWLMSFEDIKNIMSTRWEYWFFTQEYNRFKADKTENRDFKKHKVLEYLHYVKIKK